MFGLFSRTRSQRRCQAAAAPRRTRLWLEALEERHCLTAPQITLNVVMLGGHNVQLNGSITADYPNQVTITFSGAAGGTTMGNTDGTYSYTTSNANLGSVFAVGTNAQMETGNTAQASISSNRPLISNFEAIHESGNVWTFRGRVTDESPQGLVVTFGGIPSLANQTATVGADGWFYLTIVLAAGEEGTATARVTDWWGLESTIAEAIVRW